MSQSQLCIQCGRNLPSAWKRQNCPACADWEPFIYTSDYGELRIYMRKKSRRTGRIEYNRDSDMPMQNQETRKRCFLEEHGVDRD